MRFSNIHDWEIDYRQAVNLQKDLQSRVVTVGDLKEVKLVAGVDVSVALDNQATAAVVVLDYPELQVVARQVVKGYPQFPYIPGLLSFREIPLLLQAIRELTVTPDLFLVAVRVAPIPGAVVWPLIWVCFWLYLLSLCQKPTDWRVN
jgi:deoxyribonuclease V